MYRSYDQLKQDLFHTFKDLRFNSDDDLIKALVQKVYEEAYYDGYEYGWQSREMGDY